MQSSEKLCEVCACIVASLLCPQNCFALFVGRASAFIIFRSTKRSLFFAQARNQGGGEAPLENFSPTLEKCVGHSLKLLDTVQKIWALFRKLFAPPDAPSWLWACFCLFAKVNS